MKNSKRGNRKGTRPTTLVGTIITLLILLAIAIPFATAVLEIRPTINTEAMLVYPNESSGQTLMSVRNLSIDTSNLSDVGGFTVSGHTARIVLLEDSHETNESLMAIRHTNDDIHTTYWNGSAWNATFEHNSNSQNDDNAASLALEYEQLSGDALFIYEDNSSNGDGRIRYKTWNHSDKTWSAEQVYQHGFSRELEQMRLYAKPRSDDMMWLFAVETDTTLVAIRWNGTAFDNASAINLTTTLPETNRFYFTYSWETKSGDGVAFFGEGTTGDVRYSVYQQSSNNWLNDAQWWDHSGTHNHQVIRSCSDPNSDLIGVISQDTGEDIEVGIWDGAALQTNVSRPSETTSTEQPGGASGQPMDCAWTKNGKYALFTYALGGGSVDENIAWVYYNLSNWSVADLDDAPTYDHTFGSISDPIRFQELDSNPLRNEIMLNLVHTSNPFEAYLAIWNFTGNWTGIEQYNGDIECRNHLCTTFEWDRHDPAPNVSNATTPANGTNFNINATVQFNFTINDNLNISEARVNITMPNGTNHSFLIFNATGNTTHGNWTGSFNLTELKGIYNWTIEVNDTSNHLNYNTSVFGSFSAGDIVRPSAFVMLPNGNTSISQNVVVALRLNATDETAVSTVVANVTMPNGSVQGFNVSNTSSYFYEVNFSNTDGTGTYTVNWTVNDTSNNVNHSTTDTFGVGDSTPPTVLNLTPNSTSYASTNILVNFTVNVTDNGNKSLVIVNVSYPQGSTREINMTNATSADIYNVSFTANETGTYNLSISANDTSRNVNASAIGNFTAGDITPPAIVLSLPVNDHNQTSNNVSFNWTVTDNFQTTINNCSLIINDVVNTTNTTITNNSAVTVILYNMTEGNYNYSVNCTDDSTANNQNTSGHRNFTVDNTAAAAINNTFRPNTEDQIDPNVTLNVTAGLRDLHRDVQSALFQFRLNGNGSVFTNVSMAEIQNSGTWHVNWTPNVNGTFFYRFFMTDTMNLTNTSPTLNTSVQWDRTWQLTPTTQQAKNVIGGTKDFNLVNITFNNSGDFALNFTASSSRTNSTFNSTFPVEVQPNKTATVEVNDSAPTTHGLVSVQITANASPNANPSSRTSNAPFVIAADAFLTTTFTESQLKVSQGEEGVTYEGQVKNVGNKTANNVTVTYTFPSDWNITEGLNSSLIDELVVNETVSHSISVDIPANATGGTRIVEINASGVNTTGTNLSSVQSVAGEKINVTVLTVGEITITESTSTSTPAGDSGSSSATSGSSTKGGIVKKAVGLGETIHTTEVFEILRGKTQGIPITVSNIYENALLKDVNVEVQGFMSQYVTITPVFDPNKLVYVDTSNVKLTQPEEKVRFRLDGMAEHSLTAITIGKQTVSATLASQPINFTISNGTTKQFDVTNDSINDIAVNLKEITKHGEAIFRVHKLGKPKEDILYFGEGRNYSLSIFAPPYLQQQDYNLTIKITGKLVPVNETLAGFAWRPLTEFRKLLFVVHEVSEEDAQFSFKEAQAHVSAMESAGMPVTKVQKLLSKAVQALTNNEFGKAAQLGEKIARLRKLAFDAQGFITEVEQGVAKAKSEWLDVPETEQVLVLAKKAFAREDFDTALQRGKDAQLLLLLETKGRLNIIWFFLNYWWAVILGGIALSAGGFLAYKKVYVLIITTRLRNLTKEEESIHELMKEAQHAHLSEGSISSSHYHKVMAQYTERLNKIKQVVTQLRNKRVGILRTEEELASLKHEKDELLDLMKKAQIDYLEKGTMSRSKFMEAYEQDKERLAEVEEEREVLREKLSKEKISKKHKILTKINQIMLWVQAWMEKRKKAPLHIQEKKKKMMKKLKKTYSKKKGKHHDKEKKTQEPVQHVTNKVKEKIGVAKEKAKEKVVGLLKKAPHPKEVKEKISSKMQTLLKEDRGAQKTKKSLLEEAEELLAEAESELIEEADYALKEKEKKNLKEDITKKVRKKQGRSQKDPEDVLQKVIRKRKISLLNKVKAHINKAGKTLRGKKKALRRKIERYDKNTEAEEKELAAKVAKQLQALGKLATIKETKPKPSEEIAAKKQLSKMVVTPVRKTSIVKKHKPNIRQVKKALHDIAEKAEPQRSKIKELMRHFPGALKKEEWKKALTLEEQQRQKQPQKQLRRTKSRTTQRPLRRAPEKRHQLSEKPEAKKKRDKIYKNLREKFGINAQEPHYKEE